jgi:hypothetical protein
MENNPIKQWKKNLGSSRPWDLLNKNIARVEEVLQKERMSICRACPMFISATGQCKKCGCIMELKTKLAHAECPIEKWSAVDFGNNKRDGLQ